MSFFISLNLVNKLYKNIIAIVASRKSKIYHQPLHAFVNKPVKKPAIADMSAILIVFLTSIVITKSHVTSNGKNITHMSLSVCKLLDKKAPLTAIIKPAKKPPILPAIFLAIKNTSSTHNAEISIVRWNMDWIKPIVGAKKYKNL